MSWGHDNFQLTEWLINYSGGFVRRGLPGTIIGLVSCWSGIQANHLIIVFSLICYGILVFWFLRRSTLTFPAILILSCVVLGFPAYQESIVRKDCLGLLFLLLCLSIKHRRIPRHYAIAAINLVAIAAILSHEAFAFYGLPALVVYGHRIESPVTFHGILNRSLALLPAGICFLCVTRMHGTPEIAQAVNDSWLPLWRIIDPTNPHLETPAAAIEALGWSPEKGISLGLTLLTSGIYQPAAWIILYVVSFGLVVIFTGRNTEMNDLSIQDSRIRVSALLLMQFLFISPLFLLGFDYGRWLFFWVASSIMLHTKEIDAPRWVRSTMTELFQKMKVENILRRMPAKDWYLLFFGIPACWNIREFLISNPVIRHLHIVWSWF